MDCGQYCVGYNTVTGEHLGFVQHSKDVYDMTFDGTGQVLVTGSWNQKLSLCC